MPGLCGLGVGIMSDIKPPTKDRTITDDIKSTLDIVDIIGENITLIDAGNDIFTGAISPDSKSGKSLHVDRKKQVYYDFAGFADGGDVLSWFAYLHNLDAKNKADFPAVLKIGAEKAGIEYNLSPEETEDEAQKYDLSILMTAIAEHYHNQLEDEHRAFIKDTWGISDETIDQIRIGFAPRGKELIEKFDDVFDKDLIYETGLVFKFNGDHKDLFNGRIVFPYWKNGKVAYFIGRWTDWTPDNKYERDNKYIKQLVYSEKRPYISKHVSNQYFFGEDTIRRADSILITEGVTDCITAIQNSIPCISPVTTEIKKAGMERAYELVKNTSKITICNDNDDNEAGNNGAIKTARFLTEKGLDVRLVELPKEEDQDKIDLAEYLRDNSVEEFNLLIDNAKSLYQVELEGIELDQDPAKRIDDAISFICSNLVGCSRPYINTFIDHQVKKHFSFSASQTKDIKSAVLENTQDSDTSKRTPLSQDKIDKDAEGNKGINVPSPYCLKTTFGDIGTFKHSVMVDRNTREEKDKFDVICYNPTWLTSSFVDHLTKKHYLELCYGYKGGVIAQIVSQKDLLTVAGLKGLTAMGLNVPESRTKALADYFAKFISKSTTLKEQDIYSKFGWSVNNEEFIIGENKISVNNTTKAHLVKDIELDTIQAFTPYGTPEGWLDTTRGLLQYDNVRFVCYTAVSALLLKVLSGASYIVELVDTTAKGKTLTAQLAMSMFGNPKTLMMATNVTKTFIERTCAIRNDLPLLLDETSLIEPDILTEITYMVSNETGKGRAKKDGGVNEIDRWKCVMITTGEVPLINLTSLAGQEVRTISCGGVGKHDLDSVEHFKKGREANYGQIAPLLIKEILQREGNLRKDYEEIRKRLSEYSNQDTTGVMGRMVDAYALISVAGFLFEGVMQKLGENPVDAGSLVEKMFYERSVSSDGSLADRAHSIIWGWITENRRNFCQNKGNTAGEKYALYGNISMEFSEIGAPYDYVDILHTKLKEILDKKFNRVGISKQILKTWADTDKIIPGDKGRATRKVVIKEGDGRVPVIRLRSPEAVERL